MPNSVNSDNERIPKSSFEIYRAEADSLLRNDEFAKAADSYSKALELREGDRHCLVSRSKCYLRMDKTDEALKDVEESLKNDKKGYYKGVLQKAEVLYFKGDFENALVYYHRGNKLRPELEEFRKGIQKAEEAINNSVGDSSIVLTCDGDLSYFYEYQEKAKKPRGGYSKQKQVQEKKKVERKQSSMDSKTQKKLLGQLYHDYSFLNHMVKDEKHTTHKTQNSEEINELAIEALNFLESRTEFWQQQSPARASKSARKDSGKANMQPARYVLNSLEEIDKKQLSCDHSGALRQARQVMKHVNGWNEKDLSNKQEVIANLHSIMGNCYLDLGDIPKALKCHEKDLEIGKANDIPEAVSRAQDNLGRCYAKKSDYRQAITIWVQKVETSQSGLESAWLLHEIGRCHLELSEFEEARKYGEESLKHAQEIDDNSWMLNASVLVAQSEVRLKDYQGAIDTFDRALDYAEVMNNKDAQAAIKKAIADVNNQIVQDETAKDKASSDDEKSHRSDDSDSKAKGGRSGSRSSRSSSPKNKESEKEVAKKEQDDKEHESPKESPKEHSPKHSSRGHSREHSPKGHSREHSPKGHSRGNSPKGHSSRHSSRGRSPKHSPKGHRSREHSPKGHSREHSPKGHSPNHSPRGQEKKED